MTILDKTSLVSFSSIICPFCFAKHGLCRFKSCLNFIAKLKDRQWRSFNFGRDERTYFFLMPESPWYCVVFYVFDFIFLILLQFYCNLLRNNIFVKKTNNKSLGITAIPNTEKNKIKAIKSHKDTFWICTNVAYFYLINKRICYLKWDSRYKFF